MNNWNFLGRLGADPALKNVGERVVCSLRVAVKTSDKENDTTWTRVSVWGRHAEWVANRFKKGDLIAVSGGEVRLRTWKTTAGEERASLEAAGYDIRCHATGRSENYQPTVDRPNVPGPTRIEPKPLMQSPPTAGNPSLVGSDDDIPF